MDRNRREVPKIRVPLILFIASLGVAINPSQLREILLFEAQAISFLAQPLSCAFSRRVIGRTIFQTQALYKPN